MHTFWFINISTHCVALRVPSLGLTNGSSFLAVKPLGALAKINCTTAATVYRLDSQCSLRICTMKSEFEGGTLDFFQTATLKKIRVFRTRFFSGWPPEFFSDLWYKPSFFYWVEKIRVCRTWRFYGVWNWPWFLESEIRVQIKRPIKTLATL